MKLKRFHTRRIDDPMGALNDLSFLLIIYFLVIAGFNTNRGFLVNLPSRENPRLVQREDLLKLSVDSGGDLLFRGGVLSDGDLDELLRANLSAHPNLTVFLSLAPDVPYQRFIDVLYIVRERHVENFSFAMSGGPPGSE